MDELYFPAFPSNNKFLFSFVHTIKNDVIFVDYYEKNPKHIVLFVFCYFRASTYHNGFDHMVDYCPIR